MTHAHDAEEHSGLDKPDEAVPDDEELEIHPETIMDLTMHEPEEADAVRGGRHNDTCDGGMSCRPNYQAR